MANDDERDFRLRPRKPVARRERRVVAELGAAFLCAELGITPEVREDHAAYLGHWLTVLKEDKRLYSPPQPMRNAPPII